MEIAVGRPLNDLRQLTPKPIPNPARLAKSPMGWAMRGLIPQERFSALRGEVSSVTSAVAMKDALESFMGA